MAQEKKKMNDNKHVTKKVNATKKNIVQKKVATEKKEKMVKKTSTVVKESPKVVENEKIDTSVSVGLNRESQKNYKIITKIIAIFALLGRILTIIAIPLVFVAAIFFIVVVGKIDYNEDRLYFGENEIAVFEEDESGDLTLRINAAIEGKNISIRDNVILKEAQKLLKKIPKGLIISTIIFTALFYEISFVLWVFIYRKLESLFNALNEGDTPFTEKNALYIKNIANLLVISTIVMALGSGIVELFLHVSISFNSGMISIMSILIVYSLYFIFKYGVKLQSKANMTIAYKK